MFEFDPLLLVFVDKGNECELLLFIESLLLDELLFSFNFGFSSVTAFCGSANISIFSISVVLYYC